jgi:hypothetical protein
MHSITQWLVPIATAVVYQGFLKNTIFKPAFRRSPIVGHTGIFIFDLVGFGFLGLATILWLNLSPFYIAKEKAQ